MRFSRRAKIVVLAIVIAGSFGAYAVGSRGWFSGGIPEEFMKARSEGALISQNIVDLTNGVSASLQEINTLDAKGDYENALVLTNTLMEQSQEVRRKATDLSRQMEVMARALPGIDSDDARQAALDSISDRLALLSRLVNYSSYLTDLLNALRNRFSGIPTHASDVSNLVREINAEVTAVNNFNREAGDAMNRFDSIVRGNR